LHTLYISPLKALAVDVARNLEAPMAEMGLDVRAERAPATRRPAAANANDIPRRIFCSPPPNNWRCCCRIAMRRGCSSI